MWSRLRLSRMPLTDGVPHALHGLLRATMALEPVKEADVVQVPDVLHATLRVDESAHNRAGAQGQRIGCLVADGELGCGEEGLQACRQR